MTVVVVSNAGTPRARRQVPALRDALPESPGLQHRVTEHAADLDALVGHDRWNADDLLVINGGDGSVQHALTLLIRHCPGARWPVVACLPGGSTNMTALDLNATRRYRDAVENLAGLVRRRGPLPVAPRPVVRVNGHGARDTAANGGLFFGIGTIVQGVEYFHDQVKGCLQGAGRHELAAGAALLRALWGIARRQPPFDEPVAAAIDAPSLGLNPTATLSLRLLFATTLDRLFLGMRPYWGDAAGAMKTTLVEGRAQHFIRRVPRLLRGRPDAGMDPANGYHSSRLDSLTLSFHGSYTLDGELFSGADDRMTVSATTPVRFLPL
ncbi:MAG: diacylglycerol kinase family protein [Pseudomonadales bacterium]